MRRRLLFLVGAAAAAVVAGIVVLVVALQAPAHSLTVTNEGRPALIEGKATNVAYWVPMSAPLEELDAAGSSEHACSPELSTWLTAYGTLLPSPQALLLRTDATDPIEVSFDAEGSFSEAREGLLIQCGAPSLPTTTAEEGELEWTTHLLRLEDDADGNLRALTATADGPKPTRVQATAAHPVGLVGIIQGDVAFDGTIRAHAGGATAALPFESTASDETKISWPGLPSRGTLRVSVSINYDGQPAFYCQVASAASLGDECLPASGDEETTIRTKAQQVRSDYVAVRDSVAAEYREPRPAPGAGSQTQFVRLSPWSDPAIQARGLDGELRGSCNQDSGRADRADCEGGQECYLNEAVTKVACREATLGTWFIYGITLPVSPAQNFTTSPTLYPVGLGLVNGAQCTLDWRDSGDTIEGWSGPAGYCVEDDGTQYPFWAADENGPLDQPYLFEPGKSGYLRLAVRDGTSDHPDYEDVAELYY